MNKLIIKNCFRILGIDDILDKVDGWACFSQIDLKSGYHQIRVVFDDVPLEQHLGLEYLVMPFALTNALATFNRIMDRIFMSIGSLQEYSLMAYL